MLACLNARAMLVAALVGQISLIPGLCTAHAAALPKDSPTGVLGLDGPDEAASLALTEALRREIERKGNLADVSTTLAEVRLMAGCGEQDFECIARAGRPLKSDVVIFGRLTQQESGYRLELRAVSSESTQTLAHRTFDFDYNALASDRIGATASLILSIFNDEVDEAEAAIPVSLTIEKIVPQTPKSQPGQASPLERAEEDPPVEDAIDDAQESPTREQPASQPRYPVALAIGTVVSAGLTLGAGLFAIKTKRLNDGKYNEELFEAAKASINDDDPENDVPPGLDGDLCEVANEPSGGGIHNPQVSEVCSRGKANERRNHIAFGATIGFGVLTLGLASAWMIKAATRRKKLNSQQSAQITPVLGVTKNGAALGLHVRF
jgi:hypothetical protein